MAIDLNAISNMFATKAQQKEISSNKFRETISAAYKSVDANNKAITATEAGELDNYLKTLSYASSDEDIQSAYDMNDAWLSSANSRERFNSDKKVNQAIYDAKKSAIDMISDRQDDYNNLNANINVLSNELQNLQTSDNEEYDFTEITKVLDDYRQAGEAMISYNQNWVGKQEYKDNIKEVKNWMKTGKFLQAMDVDPYSKTTIPAVVEDREEVINPGQEGIDMSFMERDVEAFDAESPGLGFDSMMKDLDMANLTELLPEGFTMDENQKDKYMKAFTSIQDSQGFINESETAGYNFSDGVEYMDDQPTGEFQGKTEELNQMYQASAGAVNEFLDSLKQDYIPEEIRKYQEVVQEEQIIEEGTPGIQLSDEYKDQPYYSMLIENAFDSWKIGDEAGANSAMGLARQYMVQGVRAQDEAEAEIVKNENKYLADRIPNLTEDSYQRIKDYSDRLTTDPNADVPEGMSDEDVKTAQRIATGGEYFPKIASAFSDKGLAIKDARITNVEQGLNQTFSNIDNFLDIANLGDLAKSLEKLKPYSTSDKKLRNPEVRGKLSVAVVENIEDFFKDMGSSMLAGYKDTDNDDIDKILDDTYSEGTKEWYSAMDRILDMYLPKNADGVRVAPEDINDLAGYFPGKSAGFSPDSEERNKMKGLLKLIDAYGALRDFDTYLGQDPLDELGIFKDD